MPPRTFLLLSCFLAGSIVGTAQTPGPATTQADDHNYRSRPVYQTQYDDYLQTMRGKRCDIVFIGDSITEQWRWGPGKPVWDKHYAARALNFGQSADRTQNTIWRLQNLPLDGFAPKVAVLLIGTNNYADSPEDIVAGVKAVIATTEKRFPGIKFVLISILPNARATEKMAQANQLLATLHDGAKIHYLDLASKFTPEGDNWTGLTKDKLHLSVQGYEMWAEELNPLLAKLLK